jgi:F-type H+-transporting ATPase subunit epsilon
MNLKILLPFEVFADETRVSRIVADTGAGSLELLEHRLDCAAALVPGILVYQTQASGTVYLAVDEGVMVKQGPNVMVSVHQAVGGKDLGQLHDAVQRQFLKLDREQREVRDAIAKLEGGLIGRFAEFQHG